MSAADIFDRRMKKKSEAKQKKIKQNAVRVPDEVIPSKANKAIKRTADNANITKSREELDNSFETEELVFEDPFEDEFEEEEIDEDDAFDYDENEELSQHLPTINESEEGVVDKKQSSTGAGVAAPKKVWRPEVDKINDGEALDYDPSAYVMYHSLQTEWPCLSFDIIKDSLGDNRQRFPLTMYMVTGSQADQATKNKITLLKLSDLHKTQSAIDSENESEDDDDDLDDDPTIQHLNIPHPSGGVNRLRSSPQHPGLIASLSDCSSVHIYDVRASLQRIMNPASAMGEPPSNKPIFTYNGHRSEGFAVDWCPVAATNRLATGDCNGLIHIWNSSGSAGGSGWSVDGTPYSGHQSSVEDIQWSPAEGTVFSSCSADCTVRIWDTRGRNGPQITWTAHPQDVNVISWNKSVGYLLASGSDDGTFKVWDLRAVSSSKAATQTPLAFFNYHKGAITSIEWAAHDESVISLSSADNQVTIWDLSVEADEDAAQRDAAALAAGEDLSVFPPQLLFIHQGQHNVKEVHFHPQIPGVLTSTAEDGFNIFKPAISVSS